MKYAIVLVSALAGGAAFAQAQAPTTTPSDMAMPAAVGATGASPAAASGAVPASAQQQAVPSTGTMGAAPAPRRTLFRAARSSSGTSDDGILPLVPFTRGGN